MHIALLNYPAYNKRGDVVATAVANMDIHDIARTARTYEIRKYYIVTPIESQRMFVERILAHWRPGGVADDYNPDRAEALKTVVVKETLDQVIGDISICRGKKVKIVATGANQMGNIISFGDMSRLIGELGEDYLVLFGTGWGMTKEVIAAADYRLEPISGAGRYNHLSVRSASAIILDRLCHGR